MKDIGAVLASLFVIFILISLLFGLNSSLGKTADSGTLEEAILLHWQDQRES
jgi:hypothetical protein